MMINFDLQLCLLDHVNNKTELDHLFGVPKPKKVYDESGKRVEQKRGTEVALEQFMGRKKNNINQRPSVFSGHDLSRATASNVMYPPVLSVHSDHPKYIHPK